MDNAKTRKDAMRIESALLNKITAKGVSAIANAIGVNPSQITRWKESLIPRMSMVLAVLEWGVVDDDTARLAKAVAREVEVLLRKKKSPMSKTEDFQISMEF